MSAIPKAVLYYSPTSVWSAVARLALEEKGYAPEEVDLKIVDLSKGENYDPTFLRLNPKATVPTLVVPLSNTLSEEVDSRYKAITESKAIAEFLDKSRSFLSRTHTTSTAPAPALAPATIAATSIARTIIDIVHSEEANPSVLKFNNARDDGSLAVLAKAILGAYKGKEASLKKNIAEGESGAVQVSQKTMQFWTAKLAALEPKIVALETAGKEAESLTAEEKEARAAFFEAGKQAWEVSLPQVLKTLSKEIVGQFALGDQFSIADLHLAAWFTRVAVLVGAEAGDDGKTVVAKLEKYIGLGEILPRDCSGADLSKQGEKVTKLEVYWDGLKGRGSWQKVYGQGLF